MAVNGARGDLGEHGARAPEGPREQGEQGEQGGRRDVRSDRGVTTIEVVILAPVMFLFILVLVAFGQLVDGRGGVDGAARDAVRAASLQRTVGEAQTAAQRAAEAQLEGDVCTGPVDVDLSGNFAPPEPGEASSIITVEVTCEVKGLGMLGLDIDPRMTGSSSAPLDPYRRAA